MIVILVTNDDGIDAVGLKLLAQAMDPLSKVLVVAPTVQRSGESKSLTFSRPLRIAKNSNFNVPAYSIDGTPADSVVIGKHLCRKEYGKEPDLVVSGINAGDNTSIHALLTSGTCAAAFEGALLGIPSIAFSYEVKSTELFYGGATISDYTIPSQRAQEIVKIILKKPLPDGIRFLNVNFPASVQLDTPIEIVTLCREKYINDVIIDQDPRGSEIYWIWGDSFPSLPEHTDAYALTVKKNISITPISLGFGRWALPKLENYFRDTNISLVQTENYNPYELK